jgi:thioredoxin
LVRAFDTPINTTDQSIDRVLSVNLPTAFVFVDGKAPTALEDVLNRAAREYAGKLLVVQIQIKDNPASVQRYQVVRAPAIVAVRDGQVLSKAEGVSAAEAQQHIMYLLGKGAKPVVKPHTESTSRASDQRTTKPAQEQPSSAGRRAPSASARPQAVTDATFEHDVLRSAEPVLVDFWAPWCGPCRMMEPVLERLAQEHAGKLRVAKMNVDENPITPQQYGVQGIPTMVVVKRGQVVDRWTGALPEAQVRSRLARHLG